MAQKATTPPPQPPHISSAEAYSEAIFSSIGDGAIVTDERGHIAKVNQAALDLLGLSEKEVLHAWYPAVMSVVDDHGEEVRRIDQPIVKAFLSGKPVSERSYYKRKDGTILPVLVTVSPIIFDGKPIGAVQVFKDYTAEHAIDQMKTDFISIASHQLRTPATGVRQYIAMLLDGYAGDLDEEQCALLKKAFESNDRQLQIVEDLLQVAHIDSGQVHLLLEQTDVTALVRDIIAEQQAKFDSKQQPVIFKTPKRPIMLDIDRARLRMALENIIDNAHKYTPEQKSITISLSATTKSARITVHDEGIGIRPGDLQRIFQKFSRLEQESSLSVSGTGLGLYWANKIIELHGGKIRLDSTYRKGSTFTVQLPLQAPVKLQAV